MKKSFNTGKLAVVLSLVLVLAMVFAPALGAKAADMTEDEILAAIATLEAGKSLEGTQVLTGEITSIKTAYSADYDNISVVIKVKESEILAYRLKAGSELKVGDKIKVTGTITNYKGTIEFASGCTYEMVAAAAAPEVTPSPTPEPVVMTDEAAILAAVATLESGKTMDGKQVLTGVITKIDTAYSADYKNITVTIKVADTELLVYRLKGGEELKVGDKIKVTGTITNYNGTVEYKSGCTYEMVQAAAAADPTPTSEAVAATPTSAPAPTTGESGSPVVLFAIMAVVALAVVSFRRTKLAK